MSATEIIRRFMRRAAKQEAGGDQLAVLFERLEKLGHERQGIVNVDTSSPSRTKSLPDLAVH
jgi:hypothetical protein